MSPPPQLLAVQDLNRAISGGKLEPVYLFHGEEEFNKEAKIQQLIEATLDAGERDFDLEVRYAGDLNAEVLDSLLNTPPLLASRRVVVLRDITALKKAPRQILDRYLASPAPELLLILVESGPLSKSEKGLPSLCSLVDFPRLSRADLQKWVEQYSVSSKEARIAPAAAKLLIDVVGDDMGELASELDKLASYSANAVIDVAAVEDLVGVRHGETLTDLLDAIAFRDLNRALALVGHVLSQSRTTGVSVLMALTTQTFGLAYARALMEEGVHTSRMHKSLFDFLSAGGKGIITARPWGEAVNSWVRAAGSWTSAELEDACEALLRADIGLKDTRASSDEQLLTSLILELFAHQKSGLSKR